MKKYTIYREFLSNPKEVWAESYIQALLEERTNLIKKNVNSFTLEIYNKTDRVAVYSKS